ncbi:YceD family protein [Sunxiuqinia sp. A32]|uniref:YceD family protein n=1 Tax=Sunxiuqinia sp. A32 TaxID=3461496 RepID=UPI0040457713
MTQLSKYNIAFKGLGQGKHEFEFQIGKRFFEYFDGGIAEDGNVDVKVTLEKQSSLMALWFQVKGTVGIQCDRCLDLFDQPIESENKIFIKYGEETFDEGDDVIWVSPTDHQVNVGKLIYDFIILSIPIQHVHPEKPNGKSNCNPEMLEKISGMSYLEKPTEETDSRWDELKKLLDNE